jgi:hypothetical protein
LTNRLSNKLKTKLDWGRQQPECIILPNGKWGPAPVCHFSLYPFIYLSASGKENWHSDVRANVSAEQEVGWSASMSFFSAFIRLFIIPLEKKIGTVMNGLILWPNMEWNGAPVWHSSLYPFIHLSASGKGIWQVSVRVYVFSKPQVGSSGWGGMSFFPVSIRSFIPLEKKIGERMNGMVYALRQYGINGWHPTWRSLPVCQSSLYSFGIWSSVLWKGQYENCTKSISSFTACLFRCISEPSRKMLWGGGIWLYQGWMAMGWPQIPKLLALKEDKIW